MVAAQPTRKGQKREQKMSKQAWEAANEAAEKASSGGKFFKLAPGAKARVIFVGAPEAVKREFDGREFTRIAINLVNVETPDTVQVWEMSPSAFKSLNEVVSIKGQRATYHVKRIGEGLKTTYSFIHDKDLSADQLAKLAKLELHEFDSTPGDSANEPDADEDVPF